MVARGRPLPACMCTSRLLVPIRRHLMQMVRGEVARYRCAWRNDRHRTYSKPYVRLRYFHDLPAPVSPFPLRICARPLDAGGSNLARVAMGSPRF